MLDGFDRIRFTDIIGLTKGIKTRNPVLVAKSLPPDTLDIFQNGEREKLRRFFQRSK